MSTVSRRHKLPKNTVQFRCRLELGAEHGPVGYAPLIRFPLAAQLYSLLRRIRYALLFPDGPYIQPSSAKTLGPYVTQGDVNRFRHELMKELAPIRSRFRPGDTDSLLFSYGPYTVVMTKRSEPLRLHVNKPMLLLPFIGLATYVDGHSLPIDLSSPLFEPASRHYTRETHRYGAGYRRHGLKYVADGMAVDLRGPSSQRQFSVARARVQESNFNKVLSVDAPAGTVATYDVWDTVLFKHEFRRLLWVQVYRARRRQLKRLARMRGD